MSPPNVPRPRLRVGLSRRPSGGPSSLSPSLHRRPLHSTQPSSTLVRPASPVKPTPTVTRTSGAPSIENSEGVCYFSVLYTKRSKKKHKSWLDGYVILTNDRHVQLQNEDGKNISSERLSKPLGGLKSGNTLEIVSWELEVQNDVKEDDYLSGRLFAPPPSAKTVTAVKRTVQRQFKPLRPRVDLPSANPEKAFGPLHDPTADDAVVLSPVLKDATVPSVPIVLDPFLAKRMRPHQRDGVQFLYDCTAGRVLRDGEGGEGAILADEMGLGKSLQAIALVWTLLKQGPFGMPLAKKAVIVCPASLVRNWVNEVRKWLGDDRLKPVALESGVSTFESKQAMAAFISGSVRKLLIISYEMFRTNAADIYTSQCGLMICDEGHRLKSAGGNKTIEALRKLPCKRRVILTGTPVQNDLEEFYAVCDFVNPGCLNSLSSFRSVFENPIIASRDSNASTSVSRLGQARATELSRIASQFVLRRTSDLLEKYLPPKSETAIFCRLKSQQGKEYAAEARRWYADIFGNRGVLSAALCAINVLRKICSHPALIDIGDDIEELGEAPHDDDNDGDEKGKKKSFAQVLETLDVRNSAKMQVTASICDACVAVGDKVIIVSNFTTVLDLLQEMLRQRKVAFCRLDGSTAVSHRGDIVRRFNDGSLGDVFLLSAKAGGVGLNLIGANRLILFDPDWNPATDIQAMARVWRDGQKKHVYVYRLLSTGTIEEKIFQRQLFKGELQSALEGEKQMLCEEGGVREGNFKAEELKDVFQYNGDVTFCETLNVLERSKEDRNKAGLLEHFKKYKEIVDQEDLGEVVWCGEDDVLHRALNGCVDTHGVVTYLYTKASGLTHLQSKSKVGNHEIAKSQKTDEEENAASAAVKRRRPERQEQEAALLLSTLETGKGHICERPNTRRKRMKAAKYNGESDESEDNEKDAPADISNVVNMAKKDGDEDFTWDDALRQLDEGE